MCTYHVFHISLKMQKKTFFVRIPPVLICTNVWLLCILYIKSFPWCNFHNIRFESKEREAILGRVLLSRRLNLLRISTLLNILLFWYKQNIYHSVLKIKTNHNSLQPIYLFLEIATGIDVEAEYITVNCKCGIIPASKSSITIGILIYRMFFGLSLDNNKQD